MIIAWKLLLLLLLIFIIIIIILFHFIAVFVVLSIRRDYLLYFHDFVFVYVQVFLIAVFFVFGQIFKSSRAFFLRCFQHILFSPLYKVI